MKNNKLQIENAKRQKAFRNRMQENGYRLKRVWVKPIPASDNILTKQVFSLRLTELTKCFSPERRSNLYHSLLEIAEALAKPET
ncbi:MAG: hypothetical protein Ta2F_18530 [Termitinemataceae bacterium]|nr:MAG: hypothetical protein Ta2F_18530 [Termitinemataceae bacterium]